MMSQYKIFLLSVFLVTSSIGFAGEIELKKEQIEKLLSGNTMVGRSEDRNKDIKYYIDPKGEIRGSMGKEKRSGTWSLNKDNQHCIKWDKYHGRCAFINQSGDKYLSYKWNQSGSRLKHMNTFKIEQGNPYKF